MNSQTSTIKKYRSGGKLRYKVHTVKVEIIGITTSYESLLPICNDLEHKIRNMPIDSEIEIKVSYNIKYNNHVNNRKNAK